MSRIPIKLQVLDDSGPYGRIYYVFHQETSNPKDARLDVKKLISIAKNLGNAIKSKIGDITDWDVRVSFSGQGGSSKIHSTESKTLYSYNKKSF